MAEIIERDGKLFVKEPEGEWPYDPGPVPATPPPPTLDQLIVTKTRELETACGMQMAQGIQSTATVSGQTHHYFTDPSDVDDVASQLVSMTNFPNKPDNLNIEWRTMDAGMVMHTAEEFRAVANEIDTFAKGVRRKLSTLKIQVEAATTPEEVAVIKWN